MKTSFLRTWPVVAAVIALSIVAFAGATQPPRTPPDIGFRPIEMSDQAPTCKVGHWCPLHVPFFDASDPMDFVVSAVDSEDDLVLTRTPFPRFDGPPSSPTWKSVPAKFGRLSNAVRIPAFASAGIGTYLYLCIGGKLEELPAALVAKERRAEEEGALRDYVPTRFAVYENEVDRLPRRSLEYETADLVILLTGDPRFVGRLNDSNQILPLLQWVRDGGRLVVSMHPDTATRIESMIHDFESPGKPYQAPETRSTTLRKLVPIETWAGLSNKPFPATGSPPVPVVLLGPGPRWEAIAHTSDGTPLIATRPYGFGSLTVVTFPLDGPEFAAWAGQPEFLRTLVDQLGPRYRMPEKAKGPVWRAGAKIDDLGTELNIALDNFDVPRVPFILVALAILGYLLLAGPVDYLILRRIFGRLEWTWLTYPLIVLAVGGAAYLVYRSTSDRTALIDRVDLVDIELASGQMRGTSFFAVRSPDLRLLSMELKPNREFLEGGELDDVALSWFGRPDDGPAGMGRAGSQSFSRKEYAQSPDLARLEGVPFADRASKTFLATWRAKGTKPRLSADLVYHPRQHTFKVTGTIANDYPFDLVDASLFIFDRIYRLEGSIPAKKEIRVAIAETANGVLPTDWRDRPDPDRPTTSQGPYDPLTPLRGILFRERFDSQLERKNHLFRPLDWSWRLRDDPRLASVGVESLGVREAILVARAGFRKTTGQPAEAPTVLILTPADAAVTEATISQDTVLRAIVPLRPQP